MKVFFAPSFVVALAALVLGSCGASASSTATPITTTSTTSPAGTTGATGFLGEQSASVAQSQVANLPVPRAFAHANLLVALIAADGPDTYPATHIRRGTTAVFGGSTGLHWKRWARVSARRDVGLGHAPHEIFGASVAEIWTAVPPPNWNAVGVITCTTTHPETHDDGLAVTVAAFAHGRLDHVRTKDGLHTRTERLTTLVTAGDDVFAALFEGRMNADFVPLPGLRVDVQRRAGDDTASVLETDNRSLPAGTQTVGYASPNPGDYWEMAVAVIAPG